MNTKTYWITDSRFKLIFIALIMIWLVLMALFYFKTDEVTKNPCQICAKKMGEEVICTVGGIVPLQRTFHPNFSISNSLLGE